MMMRYGLTVWIGLVLGLLNVSCAENNKSPVAYESAPPPTSTVTPIRSAQPGLAPPRAEVEPATALVHAEEPDPDEQIWAALERQVPEVIFEELPFQSAIEWLGEHLKVNIHVHWPLLAEAGIESGTAVTVRARNVSAERLLRLLFAEGGRGQVDLAYQIDDGVLEISTREHLANRRVQRVYDVRDIIVAARDWYDTDDTRDCEEALAQRLAELIQPKMWAQNGGLCTVDVLSGLLLIHAPDSVHSETEEFLWMLREAGVGQIE